MTRIAGIPKAESDAIIKYLIDVIATTPDMHVRFHGGKNDVAIWDSRVTVSLNDECGG